MERNNKKAEVTNILTVLTILIIIVGIGFLIYQSDKMKHETYIKVIGDLDDANKCLYQCGFLYKSPQLFDNYKFCTEKCDRINERTQ